MRIVKERCIQSLIKASQQRKDKKHILYRKLSEVQVHKLCQSSYIRPCNVDAASKLATQANSTRRNIISMGREFNFSESFVCIVVKK